MKFKIVKRYGKWFVFIGQFVYREDTFRDAIYRMDILACDRHHEFYGFN